MKDLIERLYDETYSPKITPQTLLTNLNLSNYSAINYKKKHIFSCLCFLLFRKWLYC